MRTIQITIDEPLLAELDRAAHDQRQARSAWIRETVARELARLDMAAKDRAFVQSYLNQPEDEDEKSERKDFESIAAWDDDD